MRASASDRVCRLGCIREVKRTGNKWPSIVALVTCSSPFSLESKKVLDMSNIEITNNSRHSEVQKYLDSDVLFVILPLYTSKMDLK